MYLKILGTIAIVYLIITSEIFRNFLYLIKMDYNRQKQNNIILKLIAKILSCVKCSTFWVILIIFKDPFLSAISTLIAIWVDNNLSKIKL